MAVLIVFLNALVFNVLDVLLEEFVPFAVELEVVSYDDLIKEGSMVAAKERGLVRSEGKEYVMQDGDIVLFKFNVSK